LTSSSSSSQKMSVRLPGRQRCGCPPDNPPFITLRERDRSPYWEYTDGVALSSCRSFIHVLNATIFVLDSLCWQQASKRKGCIEWASLPVSLQSTHPKRCKADSWVSCKTLTGCDADPLQPFGFHARLLIHISRAHTPSKAVSHSYGWGHLKRPRLCKGNGMYKSRYIILIC